MRRELAARDALKHFVRTSTCKPNGDWRERRSSNGRVHWPNTTVPASDRTPAHGQPREVEWRWSGGVRVCILCARKGPAEERRTERERRNARNSNREGDSVTESTRNRQSMCERSDARTRQRRTHPRGKHKHRYKQSGRKQKQGTDNAEREKKQEEKHTHIPSEREQQ